MKKIGLVAIIIATLLTATGCGDAGIYKEATENLESGNYQQTIDLLNTIPNYNDVNGLRDKAQASIDFNLAVSELEQKNTSLDAVFSSAQDVLDSGKTALDASLFTTLQTTISEVRESKTLPLPIPETTAEILAAIEAMKIIDYSDNINEIITAQTNLSNSIIQYEQVTNPTGDFVINRIKNIETIVDIQGVTEDNDPNGNLNKQGGYTSTTYFSSSLIDQASVYGDSLIDKGTDAGGGIEVYATVEDANKRNDYLAGFDGGMFASGSHVVLGTVVIRTSDELTATQQNELTAQIIAVLTVLE
jgi:hypothetical protein